MKRTATILGVLAALAIPSVAAAGNVTAKVAKKQTVKAHTVKAKKMARTQKSSYELIYSSSGPCGAGTFLVVVNGNPLLAMC